MDTTAGSRRVVVIGGGYVGAPLARALDERFDVTLVDKLPVFFHRMAALRAAVDPAATTLPFLSREKLLTRGRTVTAHVSGIRPDERVIELADGTELAYDVAVIATGSLNQPITQFVGEDQAQAEEHFTRIQREIADSEAIVVVGGGITGVELVGEITAAHPGKPVVLVTRRGVTPDLPAKAAAKLTAQIEDRGVLIMSAEVPVGSSADAEADIVRRAGLDPARTLVIRTTGGAPATDWLRESQPEFVTDGGVIVDDYLRVGGRDDLFAVGDVAATAGTKGAMNARTQIPVIAANIAAGGAVKTWTQKGPRIAAVPLGTQGGVVSLGFGGWDLLLGPRAASASKGRTLMTPMMQKALGNV